MATKTVEHYQNGVKIGEGTITIPDAVARREAAEADLRGLRTTLRQWAQDATADADGYGTMTAAQRQAAQERTIRRFGLLCRLVRGMLLLLDLDDDDGLGS